MAGRGRFAPSPTGLLHLGNARTALLAWLDARSGGGTFVMRVEDLDRARVQPGAEAQQLDDLRWLGLDWDEGPDRGGPFAPYRQSERTPFYDAAVERLLADGRAFLCACSRADVARAASAPHEGDGAGEPRYPGTCRGQDPGKVQARAAGQGRAPAVRFDGRGEQITWADELWGPIRAEVDDFVLRRADGTAAYQLAVVVDDAAMRVTRVVRGGDLLASTPRQLALGRALRLPIPAFAHVPLVVTPGGERLAKRTIRQEPWEGSLDLPRRLRWAKPSSVNARPASLKSLRDGGHRPEAIVGALAASAGLGSGAPVPARDLVAGFALSRLRREPAVVTVDQAGNTSG